MTVLELKNKIILELLTKNLISIGEAIDYEKFKFLYSFYNYLPEFYFAKILEINYANYNSGLRYQKTKVTILKNFDCTIFKKEILNYLINNNIVTYNMEISYLDFIKILSLFPFLNEESLACILETRISRIQDLKFKKNAKAIILKKSFNLSAEEDAIVENLINSQLICPGQQINYELFKELHAMYPEIKECRFAYMLEITASSFSRMKNKNYHPKILKSKIDEFIKKQKQNIINDLIINKNAFVSEKINYKRFCEFYKGYEYISEENFAYYILGIKYNNFISLKFDNKNAIIFKNSIKWTDEQYTNIFFSILNTFNLKEGDMIDYDIFLAIYQIYSNYLTESKLAEILGINENRFYSLKYNNKNVRIVNGVTLQKIYFIHPRFSESRFYSKEEINNISKEYGISNEDIIIHIINRRRYFDVKDYVECLDNNNGLFIGKSKMTDTFFKEQYDNIIRYTKIIIYRLGIMYKKHISKADMTQEILLYIFNNCGDLEYNFGKTDTFFYKMSSRVQKYIFGKLKNLEKTDVTLCSYMAISENIPIDKTNVLCDNSVNVEDEAIILSDAKNDIYTNVLYLISQGYSLENSLDHLSENLDIDKNDLYEMIKKRCELILELKKQN